MGEPHGKGGLIFTSAGGNLRRRVCTRQITAWNRNVSFSQWRFYSGKWDDDKPHVRGEGKFTSDDGYCHESELLNAKDVVTVDNPILKKKGMNELSI